MSDPFNDPNASPWTRGGDPVDLSKGSAGQGWDQPPPPPAPTWGAGAPQVAGTDTPPPLPTGGGWQQPPAPDGGAWQQPPPVPDGGGWQQPPPFGPAPQGYGPDPYGQQSFGQPPYGPPPGPSGGSNTGKVVAIVLGVLGLLVIGVIVAAVLVFNAASDGVEQVVEGFEDFNIDGADIPEGPRLLEAGGSVGGFDGTETFEFTVPDRTEVQIDVVGRGGFDPVVELFDGSTSLGSNDDGGNGFDAQLRESLSSGTYTVEVSGFADDDGAFDVVVTDL